MSTSYSGQWYGGFRRRSPTFHRGRQAQSGQAPSDPNRDVWVCPPNLRNRTQTIAPATTGQMAGAPARAAKSPSISAMTTTTNAIMGASRMRPPTTAADAQSRKLLIAPKDEARVRCLVHQSGSHLRSVMELVGPRQEFNPVLAVKYGF
jgi:hypothetical protein